MSLMSPTRELGKTGRNAGSRAAAPAAPVASAGMRTCAACRTRTSAGALIRFTRDASSWHCVVPGTTQHGRGVSLCPKADCFDRACTSRKSRFAVRSTPAPASPDPSGVTGTRPAAGSLLTLAINSYQERIRLLRRCGGHQAAQPLDLVLSQLHTALLTLPPCRSGETHVR